MNKIASVVVTYNRKILLAKCIDALLNQNMPNLDIIVVDNNSNDGTSSMIEKLKNSNLIYFNTGENLGGAGGFHFGIKKAVELGYEYLWIMDDDCIPTENALSEFLKIDNKLNGNYGFLSSKVFWKDNSICKMNIQRETLTKNLDDFTSEISKIVMASFVSLFVKSSIVKKVGLPIKEFFIWTDDWEFTRRISLKYPCYFVANSVVVHKSNSNLSADISNDSYDRLNRYKYLYRNDVYLYRREGIKGFLYEVIRLSVHAFRVIFTKNTNKLKRISMIIAGTKSGFFFKPNIEYLKED